MRAVAEGRHDRTAGGAREVDAGMDPHVGRATVALYWIPLGADGHSVRFGGRLFEAVTAARRHRPRCDLYHAALVVELDGDRFGIELAPSPDADEAGRGVVATGAVGSRHAGRLRLFRYEVRCRRGVPIPDLDCAVGGPRLLSTDPAFARRVLDLVGAVPTPVWGRDDLRTGEMWNSNSVIAWLIAAAGVPFGALQPPPGGRAPGWDAGLAVARRSAPTFDPRPRGAVASTHEERPGDAGRRRAAPVVGAQHPRGDLPLRARRGLDDARHR
jgi:hypothetical protein